MTRKLRLLSAILMAEKLLRAILAAGDAELYFVHSLALCERVDGSEFFARVVAVFVMGEHKGMPIDWIVLKIQLLVAIPCVGSSNTVLSLRYELFAPESLRFYFSCPVNILPVGLFGF